jgi:integrase
VPHANHLVSYIKRCFQWAVTKGRPFTKLEVSPLVNLVKPGEGGVRNRALSEREIMWFFKAVEAFGDEDGFTTGLTMILYNGNRRTEMFAMPWDEYTESSGQWLIPGERTKNGDPLLLPLAQTSRDLLKARRSVSGNHTYVFPASRGDGPLAGYNKKMAAFREKMLAIAAEDRGEVVDIPNWTMHDLRRTLRTGMGGLRTPEGESLVAQNICERVINHRPGKMVGTYDTNEYLVEKRRALMLWSEHLDALRDRALQPVMQQAA